MSYPQLDLKQVAGLQATLHTSMGNIDVLLFKKQAPKAVENFVTHAENGYYDGNIFHRVINDFMLQGGDPTGTGLGGKSIWETPFADEFSKDLYNLRGALSMANAGPDSNASQFFIVQNKHLTKQDTREMKAADYPEEIVAAYQKGGTPWLDFRHTVFGQVVSGMEVVDQIAAVQVDANNQPIEDVVIKSITVKQ